MWWAHRLAQHPVRFVTRVHHTPLYHSFVPAAPGPDNKMQVILPHTNILLSQIFPDQLNKFRASFIHRTTRIVIRITTPPPAVSSASAQATPYTLDSGENLLSATAGSCPR